MRSLSLWYDFLVHKSQSLITDDWLKSGGFWIFFFSHWVGKYSTYDSAVALKVAITLRALRVKRLWCDNCMRLQQLPLHGLGTFVLWVRVFSFIRFVQSERTGSCPCACKESQKAIPFLPIQNFLSVICGTYTSGFRRAIFMGRLTFFKRQCQFGQNQLCRFSKQPCLRQIETGRS